MSLKRPTAYLKMRILGTVENSNEKTLREKFAKTANLCFPDDDGNMRQFTQRTIESWFYRYKKNGVTCVVSKGRADKGKTRKLSPEELLEAINQVLPYFHDGLRNKREIYKKCIENGILKKDQLAMTTFYRFIREYDLISGSVEENKKRLAFAMAHANDLWQVDTMFGPYIKDHGAKMIQTKLIAFIDDASRVICHAQFFPDETIDTLIIAMKSAFYKRGVPKQLYADNGSIYCSKEITLICARVGCILRHTPVRDGASKGKIERFFRRLRDQFLIRKLDLSSLSALNKQLTEWIEGEYNSSDHSAIGMTPLQRFALDMNQIHFLSPNKDNDELFYNEEERTVKKDNTFSFKNIRYEAPVDVRCKQITIRFDRNKLDRVIVYYKNQRMGQARKLNLIENANIKREK
jgi:putative transposase